MIAFDVAAPPCVLALGGKDVALRLTLAEYERRCGGRAELIEARQQGSLRPVHSIQFDAYEPRWRVERDCIDRDVLIVGAAVALALVLHDDSDRFVDDQVKRWLFPTWEANEVAEAVARLAPAVGCEAERLPI